MVQYNTCAYSFCAWTQVVCRQLGYKGVVRASTKAEFGQGSGTIWMDNVTCRGYESYLHQCTFNGWGIHNCVHGDDAGVVCQGSEVNCYVHISYVYTVWTLMLEQLIFIGGPRGLISLYLTLYQDVQNAQDPRWWWWERTGSYAYKLCSVYSMEKHYVQ